jgi:hypothetical protein
MSNAKHLIHPITGQPVVPVGFRRARPSRGEVGPQPIWPVMGGSGEGGSGGGQGGDGSGDTPAASGDGFTPITTQDDLNKLIGKTRDEERRKAANSFADYDDLKDKASKFDELAEAKKSEIQRANDQVTTMKAEVDKIPAKVADALKSHLTSLHKISDEDAELFLTANDPELLLKQVARLTGRESERTANGNRAPREGQTPSKAPDEKRRFLRELTVSD